MRVRNEATPSTIGSRTILYREGNTHRDVYTFPPLYERTTTDVVVPGFAARSAQGEIFNNPFSSSAWYRSYAGYYYNERRDGSGFVDSYTYDHGICSVVLSASPGISYGTIPDLSGVAGNKAMAGVNSTAFNAPLFALEWHKTRALIPQIGELLVKLFKNGRAIRRGKNIARYLPATSKNLANAWLIGRFGVTPLLYELSGACSFLQSTPPPRSTSRGNEEFTHEVSSPFDMGDGPGTWHFTQTKRVDVEWRNGILYESTISPLENAARLGISRPATVAWELVPWSFVIDRFVDISTWLDAIQPDGATRNLASWEGTKTTSTRRISCTGFTPNETFGVTAFGSTLVCDISEVLITKNRNPWTPTAVLPRWNPYTNLKHLADYASLVRQKIKRGV